MSRQFALRLGVALALLATGCAGGRTTVVANQAEYPISMSQAVRDKEGEIVKPERREVVGTFEASGTAWGMMYSSVKLTPKTEISKEVNRQVGQARGDAIVNLSVSTAHCAMNFVLPLNFLPIWPGCTNVRVRGDIVKVRPKARTGISTSSTAEPAKTAEAVKSAAR